MLLACSTNNLHTGGQLSFKVSVLTSDFVIDSPGVPPSATAHELFRGFSFVAPALLGVDQKMKNPLDNKISLAKVSIISKLCCFPSTIGLRGLVLYLCIGIIHFFKFKLSSPHFLSYI